MRKIRKKFQIAIRMRKYCTLLTNSRNFPPVDADSSSAKKLGCWPFFEFFKLSTAIPLRIRVPLTINAESIFSKNFPVN